MIGEVIATDFLVVKATEHFSERLLGLLQEIILQQEVDILGAILSSTLVQVGLDQGPELLDGI